MVRENVTWGEERIADELSLKLGICVSPRTVKGTDCQVTAKSERRTSWAVCITNTGWNSASREPSQVSAEHKCEDFDACSGDWQEIGPALHLCRESAWRGRGP